MSADKLEGWNLVYARSRMWTRGWRFTVPDDCPCHKRDRYTDADGTWCVRCGKRVSK